MKFNHKLIAVVAGTTLVLVILINLIVPQAEIKGDVDQNLPEHLLPGVAENLDTITTIKIDRGNDDVLTMNKVNDDWLLEEMDGYYADSKKAQDLLIGFRTFQTLEEKTSNPEFYARLGLQDPDGSSDENGRVILSKEDGTELANVIFGNQAMGPVGTTQRYVRLNVGPETYLVRTPVDISGSKNYWINSDILNIEPANIAGITIDRWDNEMLAIDKPTTDTVDWQVSDIPLGREITNQNNVNSVGRALQNMSFENVKSRTALANDTLTSETLFIADLYNGMSIEATLQVEENTTPAVWWTTLDISYDERIRSETMANKTPEEVKAEADELSKKTGNWAYQLPSWKIQTMTKTVNDLTTFPEDESGG